MAYSFVFFDRSDRSWLPPSLKKSLFIVLRLRWLFKDASVFCMCSLVQDCYLAPVKPLKYLTFVTSRRVIQFISLVLRYLLEARARVDLITLSNDRNVQTSRNSHRAVGVVGGGGGGGGPAHPLHPPPRSAPEESALQVLQLSSPPLR